jgi:hypothetical protein
VFADLLLEALGDGLLDLRSFKRDERIRGDNLSPFREKRALCRGFGDSFGKVAHTNS